jgi:hypothetical protein
MAFRMTDGVSPSVVAGTDWIWLALAWASEKGG